MVDTSNLIQTGFEDGEWSMFTRITSAYYGKEYYFLEPNGSVYSRRSGKILENKETAYNEFLADMEQC